MGLIESKLASMGLSLPATHPYPSPNRTAAVRVGNILFLSGHGTGRQEMSLGIRQYGKVGGDVTEAEAQLCAKSVALAMMSSIKAEVGDLDKVRRVIRLYGMVNSAPGFDRASAISSATFLAGESAGTTSSAGMRDTSVTGAKSFTAS